MRKHFLSLFKVLLALLLSMSIVQVCSAETEGLFTYRIQSGAVIITKCSSSATGAVEIPGTIGGYPVTTLSWNSFSECTKITSVTIPESVTRIETMAFYGCESLESVNIPKNVEWMGNYTFQNCTALKNVSIADGVKVIDMGVFMDCSSLQKISIPASVNEISSMAFYGTGLRNVVIPSGVKKIWGGAFGSCEFLESVVMEDGVEELKGGLFSESSVKSVTIPASVKIIESDTFSYCGKLEEINVASGNKNYFSENGVLFNKAKTILIRYPASKSDSSYIIPECVREIESEAFKASNNLVSVTYPSELKFIGYEAFSYCEKLKSAEIPEGTEILEGWAYAYCENLEEITLPDSLESVGGYILEETPYYNNSSNWVNNLLYIGKHLVCASENFAGECNVKSGTLTIAADAFYSNPGITSLKIPNGLVSVGAGAFGWCEKLATIELQSGIKYIGAQAFNDTAFYENEENWKNDILYSGNYLLTVDQNLQGAVSVPDGVKLIAGCAFSYSGVTDITLPEGLEVICGYAFDYCFSLGTVTIPESVTEIGDHILTVESDNPQIAGYFGSEAHKYALEWEYEFKQLDSFDGEYKMFSTTEINGDVLSVNAIMNAPSDYCTLLFALYDENSKLTGIKKVVINSAESAYTASFDYDADAGNTKVFLWNSQSVSPETACDCNEV